MGSCIAICWQCGSYNGDGKPAKCSTEMQHLGKPKKRCYCLHLPKQRGYYDSAVHVEIAQLVERRPSKSDVAGSSPVSHSSVVYTHDFSTWWVCNGIRYLERIIRGKVSGD